MKRTYTIALAALTQFVTLSAQNTGKSYEVSGTVCDSTGRAPEAYVTVRLINPATKQPVKAVASSADGRFTLSAPKAGTYLLELTELGKQPLSTNVSLTAEQPAVRLDTLYMKDMSSTLGAVTVTAQKPLVRAEIDKISYTIGDDPDSKTSTVLEMLRKVPMVTVDGEDNIKVNGNSSFKVYVDGKPNTMMSSNPSLIFKAYPASAIQKIEVITNPGAKYDAEGVAGVLNIVTNQKTTSSGYTLTANVNAGNRGQMGSLFGMAQFGKFMLSAHYGIGNNRQPGTIVEQEREIFSSTDSHLYQLNGANTNRGIFQFGSLDASYEFSSKDLLSVSAGIHGWKGHNNSDLNAKMFKANGDLNYSYATRTRAKDLYMDYDVSADFQHSFTPDQKLTFSYKYNLSPQNEKQNTEYADLVNITSDLGLKEKKVDPDRLSYEHTAQIDFTTPLDHKKNHTLSVGAKYINRLNRSNSEEYAREAGTTDDFLLDEEQSVRFRHRGDIFAGYAEYNMHVDKWTLLVGQRYENYHVRATYPDGKQPSFTKTIGDWVPSASIGFNPKPATLLKMGYNLRIGRPDISNLSPFREQYSPEVVSYGNPALDSERGHNLNFTFSTFGPKLTLNASLTYAFSNNGTEQYRFIDDQNVQNTTYANCRHSKVTTLSAFINWTIASGTRININTSGSYSDYRARSIGAHNSGFSADLFLGIDQELPWKLKLGLWGGGSSRGIELQGKGQSFYFYSLSLSRSFLKDDRMKITLNADNFIGRYTHFRSTTETSQFRYFQDVRVDMMRLSVGLSFRLGSLKSSVKKVDRSIENDDVVKSATSSASSSQSGQSQGGGY